MSEAGDGTDVYKLYSVVVHVDMLNASYFGHYICYTKDFCGNWYRIDDCKVTKVDLDEVLSQGAYMLLYSRDCARVEGPTEVECLRNSSSDSGKGTIYFSEDVRDNAKNDSCREEDPLAEAEPPMAMAVAMAIQHEDHGIGNGFITPIRRSDELANGSC